MSVVVVIKSSKPNDVVVQVLGSNTELKVDVDAVLADDDLDDEPRFLDDLARRMLGLFRRGDDADADDDDDLILLLPVLLLLLERDDDLDDVLDDDAVVAVAADPVETVMREDGAIIAV